MNDQKYPSNSDLPPEQEDWSDRLNEIIMDFKLQTEADTDEPSAALPPSDAEEPVEEADPRKAPPPPKKKRRVGRIVLAAVITLVVAASLLLAGLIVRTGRQVKELQTLAQSIETDANRIIKNSKNLKIKNALTNAQKLDSDLSEVRAILDTPSLQLLHRFPRSGEDPGDGKLRRRILELQEDLTNAEQLLSIAQRGTEELLIPTFERLQTLPLSKLKSPNAKNAKTLAKTVTEILTLAEEILPTAEGYVAELLEIPVFHTDKVESKVSQLRGACVMAQPVFGVLHGDVFTWLREDLAPELCDTLAKYPPNKLDTGEKSFDIRGISAYLSLLEKNMPQLRETVDAFREESRQLPPELSGYLDGLATKVEQVTAVYDAAEKYLPLAKCYLKSDKNCDYLLVAQNSAEIRALGGFPAQVCKITVRKGILTIRDFTSIYKMLPGEGKPEAIELKLFGSTVRFSRDAVANPHFPTIASRWADDYERLGRGDLAGIISITPGILYDLLGLTGDVTLLDGTVINQENGLRYLENELYIKYLKDRNSDQEAYTNEIFADAAIQLLKGVLADLSLDKLCRCISIFEKHSADRVIMLWLRDEEGERYIHELGIDGGFNTDPRHPQLGLYFSNHRASKLGWYTDILPEIGEGTTLADGSVSYPVTLVIRNTLPRSEVENVGYYVVKSSFGIMKCTLTVVAPAGGKVKDFDGWNIGIPLYQTEYQGSEIGVANDFLLKPEKEVTFHFTVTTAPGSQDPLTVVTTPTLSEFR